MIVRRATFGDFDELLQLGRAGHAHSDLAELTFDETGAKYMASVCLADPEHCAFVVEHNSAIVGVLMGVAEKYDYLKAHYATDLLIYARRPGAGALLMNRFITWAFDERKVHRILLGVTYGGTAPERTERWYELLGARRIGGIFVIEREQTP